MSENYRKCKYNFLEIQDVSRVKMMRSREGSMPFLSISNGRASVTTKLAEPSSVGSDQRIIVWCKMVGFKMKL